MYEEGQWMFNSSEDGRWGSDSFNTKEEAIEAGKDDYDNDSFYVGQISKEDINTSVDAERVLEDISERIYDEVGEVAEDYLCHVKDEHLQILEEKLNNIMTKWMHDYGYAPSFFKIVNVERVDSE